MDYAHQKEIVRVDKSVEETRSMLAKFILKTDVQERFKKVETEIWEELASKMEKKIFDRKFDHFEQEQEKQVKQTKKELASIRESCDRMRRKTDENNHALVEIRVETEGKLSAKEGQKLWANFRKYAQYDELKDLYKRTMPAISSFEDKLKEANDHSDRVDEIIRRLDETICAKADRNSIKEFKEYCEM